MHATTGANMSFVLQPVPRSLVQQGIAHGGNALGLPLHDHQCKPDPPLHTYVGR